MTSEDLERQYASRRCDEQELLDRYPGLLDQGDADLIEIVADPLALMGDVDEVVAVAAIILQRRLVGMLPSVR